MTHATRRLRITIAAQTLIILLLTCFLPAIIKVVCDQLDTPKPAGELLG